jgi:hypothetical protein
MVVADRQGSVEPDLGRLASPWHTDADVGRPIEVVTDMSKSRVWALPGTSQLMMPSSTYLRNSWLTG